jgi:hypothetical protein
MLQECGATVSRGLDKHVLKYKLDIELTHIHLHRCYKSVMKAQECYESTRVS